MFVTVDNYYSVLEDMDFDEDACKVVEKAVAEAVLVGAGVGTGIGNTKELKVMKYETAMNTKEKQKWEKAVVEEHDRMVAAKVWKPVPKNQVNKKQSKILTTTWAMKKKADGTYRARLNARGFEQVPESY